MLEIDSSTRGKTCMDALQIAKQNGMQDPGSLHHHCLRQLLLICLLCSITRNCIQHYILSTLNVRCFIVPVTFVKHTLFTLVTQQPYCLGRPKELCFTRLSLAMETMRMRLSAVKQSFFGPLEQYGRLVTRANN